MITTLSKPKTDAKARHAELLKPFEQKLNEALAASQQLAAIAAEMNTLVDEMADELPDEEMDAFFDSWLNSEPYKRLEILDAMIHKAIWG